MGIKNFVLGVAIAILTISAAIYGIHTFYLSPEYKDFCNDSVWDVQVNTKAECESLNGRWREYEGEPGLEGYCDRTYHCNNEYRDTKEKWNKNLFYIGLPLGILIILLGAFLFKLEFVGAGLMWGGVVTIIYSTWNFFIQSAQAIKFVLSLIGLALVIHLAYKYNRPKKK